MRDFLERQLEQCWKNFDKILIAWLFMFAMAGALFIHTRTGMDEGTLDWAREITTSIFSVLAGLVGGVQIGKAMAKNGQVEPPEPPKGPDGSH